MLGDVPPVIIEPSKIQEYIKYCQEQYDNAWKPWPYTKDLVEGRDFKIISSTIKQ